MGLIPTMVSLHHRHEVPTNTFQCYHEEPETPYHALVQCKATQSVWRQISGWSAGDSSSSFIEWWKQRCEKLSERDLQLHANVYLDTAWRSIHHVDTPSEWQMSSTPSYKWNPTEISFIECNIDGALFKESGLAGMSSVIRNHMGPCICGC